MILLHAQLVLAMEKFQNAKHHFRLARMNMGERRYGNQHDISNQIGKWLKDYPGNFVPMDDRHYIT